MRILVVTQDFPPRTGGIQNFMGSLCEHLQPRCESLSVVAPGSRLEAATDTGRPFAVQRIAIHSSWMVLPMLAILPRLVRETRATHVLFAQWFPALAGIRLPKGVRQISVAYGRELLNHPLGQTGLALCGPVLRRMDAVFPITSATAALLPNGIDPSRIHVVFPGVDCSKLAPPTAEEIAQFRSRQKLSPEVKIVTTLARLVPRKGIDTLIETMSLLAKNGPECVLLVGGSGPDLPRLQQLVTKFGLKGSVRFVGRLPKEDMPAFFACGVFALLSRQTTRDVEGFGMVLTEAQACGAVVLAANSGGIPEAVGPGGGLIVEPDSPTQAAEALRRLFSDPDLRQKMGIQGRRFAQSLSWESRAEAFYSILNALT